jgi:hypothetical protein
MSETEKRTYESQTNLTPALKLVAKTSQPRRPEESRQVIKQDPAQVEKIDLLNRLINHLKAL